MRHYFSVTKHTVSCLSRQTLSEKQLHQLIFYMFLSKICLHLEQMHSLIQSQLKPVGKHIFDPNPINVQHFVDFSCLASCLTTHIRSQFTMATSDNWARNCFIWRHIHIPCCFLIEQMYFFYFQPVD